MRKRRNHKRCRRKYIYEIGTSPSDPRRILLAAHQSFLCGLLPRNIPDHITNLIDSYCGLSSESSEPKIGECGPTLSCTKCLNANEDKMKRLLIDDNDSADSSLPAYQTAWENRSRRLDKVNLHCANLEDIW